jgi:hypothetical protein
MSDIFEQDHSLKGFPERIYVADQVAYGSYSHDRFSAAFEDVDLAVGVGEPVEVGIYQLVRVAKFQKTAVEVKTLKEIKNDTNI